MPEEREWFEEWFDSIWYDILYADRNDEEASAFIDTLVHSLQPATDDHFLDLACGSGRHSIYLANLGYRVTGLDLSKRKIAQARLRCPENVSFQVHDMRTPYEGETFDFVLNLFTSFGYFENLSDHLNTLEAVRDCLKPNGKLVIDYMNARHVKRTLPCEYVKKVGGITFQINKYAEKNCVIKDIEVVEKGLHFKEKVRLFSLDDFREMLESTGFEIQTIYGGYKLSPYEDLASERLIVVAT